MVEARPGAKPERLHPSGDDVSVLWHQDGLKLFTTVGVSRFTTTHPPGGKTYAVSMESKFYVMSLIGDILCH